MKKTNEELNSSAVRIAKIVLMLVIILMLAFLSYLLITKLIISKSNTNKVNNDFQIARNEEKTEMNINRHAQMTDEELKEMYFDSGENVKINQNEDVKKFNKSDGQIHVSDFKILGNGTSSVVEGKVKNITKSKIENIEVEITLYGDEEKVINKYYVIIPKLESGEEKITQTNMEIDAVNVSRIDAKILRYNPKTNDKEVG